MTATTKLLTVVIPVYNRAGIVNRTLASVHSQNLDDTAIILVDNNSTDGTNGLLASWRDSMRQAGRDVTLLSESRSGAAAARNRGLNASESPWVMFFDSDDEMTPGHIEGVVGCIRKFPGADIIGWEISQQLPSGKRHKGRFETRKPIWNHLMHGTLSTQRYAARTALLMEAGAWNPEMRGWDDYELGVRLLARQPHMVKLKGERVVTHFLAESITGNRFSDDPQKWEQALDAVDATLMSAGSPTIWTDVRRAILAGRYRREGARSEARRLMNGTLLRHNGAWSRIALRLIATKERILPVGTTTFARLFFRR